LRFERLQTTPKFQFELTEDTTKGKDVDGTGQLGEGDRQVDTIDGRAVS
jgi:hypothetical protein